MAIPKPHDNLEINSQSDAKLIKEIKPLDAPQKTAAEPSF